MKRNNRKKYVNIDHETASMKYLQCLLRLNVRLRVTLKIFWKTLTRIFRYQL